MADRIKINKNKIEIQRNVVERGLMQARDFIKENRKIFLGSMIGLIAACVLGIGVYLIIDISMNSAQVRFEKTFEKYRAAKDSGDSETMKSLIKEFDDLEKSSTFGFYHEINYYMIGNIYFEDKQYQKAKENLLAFADKSSSKLYVQLALIKAGVAAEESGAVDEALAVYKRFEKDYPESIIAEQAFFNMATIFEKKKDFSGAKEYFNKVVSLYPQSVFAQRAKKRLLLLGGPVK